MEPLENLPLKIDTYVENKPNKKEGSQPNSKTAKAVTEKTEI